MARTYRYADRWPEIAKLIQGFKINPDRDDEEFEGYAKFAIAHKGIYIEVERATTVPWPLVAVIHRRESEATHHGEASCNFNTYLGNGQPLNIRTTIEPDGRGPFCTTLPASVEAFVAGGRDAFAIDGLSGVAQPGDRWDLGRFWGSWPIEKMVFYGEKLNGLGYWYKGLPSPYIWGGSNIQVRGKYVRDGVFDADEMDTQPGCAPILWMIGHLDPTIQYIRET